MAIEVDVYEKIRYFHGQEGLSQRGIAKQLGISRNTVKKYFDGSHVPWERQGISGRYPTVSTKDVIEFITSCFEADNKENIKKQKHTAKRIYNRLVEEKGFIGGETTVRRLVAALKDKPSKAFIPLEYDPGEAVQIDWGEATVYMQGKKTKIHLWCMRECYSADIFCQAFYRPNQESFLEGQVSGFEFFAGIPQRVIFDNARVAVKEGFGIHAKVQDQYAVFAAHYAFKTEFCNIAAGHEKGLVEGLVGWARRNIFVPLPRVDTIEELNNELLRRCRKYRGHKIVGRQYSVGTMAEVAAKKMIPLPKYRFDPSKSILARVDDFATVRFDHNKYSVPVKHVGKEVTVKGFGNEVKIVYQNCEIACYPRCYERGQTKYQLTHYLELIEQRPRSAYNAKPVKANLSTELMEIGRRLSGPREMVKLLKLYANYGEKKILAALSQQSGQEISIQQIEAQLLVLESPLSLQTDLDIKVERHRLNKYDDLLKRRVAM